MQEGTTVFRSEPSKQQNMEETLKALAFAREKYSGQLRKSGEPYIVHPLTMACNAVSLGIKEDAVIA